MVGVYQMNWPRWIEINDDGAGHCHLRRRVPMGYEGPYKHLKLERIFRRNVLLDVAETLAGSVAESLHTTALGLEHGAPLSREAIGFVIAVTADSDWKDFAPDEMPDEDFIAQGLWEIWRVRHFTAQDWEAWRRTDFFDRGPELEEEDYETVIRAYLRNQRRVHRILAQPAFRNCVDVLASTLVEKRRVEADEAISIIDRSGIPRLGYPES